jgi:cytoskeletal protein CcmA (bactofilin family)
MNDTSLKWSVPLQERDLSPTLPTNAGEFCSRIGNNMVFEGTFFTANGCDIHGKVVGHVNSLPSGFGVVRTHPHSCVQGEIRAPYISVNGEVEGLIENPVGVTVVGRSGQVNGVIRYKVLRSEGALLDASLISTTRSPG